jgi:hypothetical protein
MEREKGEKPVTDNRIEDRVAHLEAENSDLRARVAALEGRSAHQEAEAAALTKTVIPELASLREDLGLKSDFFDQRLEELRGQAGSDDFLKTVEILVGFNLRITRLERGLLATSDTLIRTSESTIDMLRQITDRLLRLEQLVEPVLLGRARLVAEQRT